MITVHPGGDKNVCTKICIAIKPIIIEYRDVSVRTKKLDRPIDRLTATLAFLKIKRQNPPLAAGYD